MLPFYFRTLFLWKKNVFLAWCAHGMLYASMATLIQPKWSSLKKTCILLSIFAPIVGYLSTLINMYNGGWGDENSRFWCHIRVMYLSGYNTIRWVASTITDTCFALSLPYNGAIWAASACAYSYYILASLEYERSESIVEEQGYDLELNIVHDLQKQRTKTINANGIVATLLLYAIPMFITGWSYTLLLYQIALSVNMYRYVALRQSFVVTDSYFDIIHFVFRVLLLWMF